MKIIWTAIAVLSLSAALLHASSHSQVDSNFDPESEVSETERLAQILETDRVVQALAALAQGQIPETLAGGLSGEVLAQYQAGMLSEFRYHETSFRHRRDVFD